MKIHLPLLIVALLLAVSAVGLSRAADASVNVKVADLVSSDDLSGYTEGMTESGHTYLLYEDTVYSSILPIATSGNLTFSSGEKENLVSLKISNGQSQVVQNTETLLFDTLSKLEISNIETTLYASSSTSSLSNYGGAINLTQNKKGKFIVSNVNDGVTGTMDLIFSDNKAITSESKVYFPSSRGGVVCAVYADITLQNNGDMCFTGNSASTLFDGSTTESTAYGGALYMYGAYGQNNTLSISGNKNLIFQGNKSSAYYSYGGAIYANEAATNISNNEDIDFTGNVAASEEGAPYAIQAHGGALYVFHAIMENNANITFSGNKTVSVDSSGGAIFNAGARLTMDCNANINFIRNSASTYGDKFCDAVGGAICSASREVWMNKNNSIVFSENNIYCHADSDSCTYGGAIMGNVTMKENASVVFNGNSAFASARSQVDSGGGAIMGNVTMEENASVEFSGNFTYSRADTNSYSYGGAIHGGGNAPRAVVTFERNGTVVFSENTVTANHEAYGGAIYAQDLSICNNEYVLFEKNAEVRNGIYRLRSVYIENEGSAGMIHLSAASGKKIEFRDSVYIKAEYLFMNDYQYDVKGEVVAQQGDIIFTGATTEADLKAVKGAAGTTSEILNSRTSEIIPLINLYGGRLRVEDSAICKGRGITVHEDSEATVRVKDAELNHAGYNLTFNAGTTLEVAGNSTIRGNVNLLADSLFKLEEAASLSLHETLGAEASTLTVNGSAILEGGSTLNANLTLAAGTTLEMDMLEAGAVRINGALTFGGKVALGEKLLAEVGGLTWQEHSVMLFTGLTGITLPVAASELEDDCVLASSVFSNVENSSLCVTYRVVDNVGSLMVMIVPEPATATLGLMSLTALAMRRRRKKNANQ